MYSLPWNSCDWNTLEDWWLEEEEEEKNVKQQQCTTRNRLQRWIFQSRMMVSTFEILEKYHRHLTKMTHRKDLIDISIVCMFIVDSVKYRE